MNEQIKLKIRELKTSMNNTVNIAKELKTLMENSNINELLTIEELSGILPFAMIQTLSELGKTTLKYLNGEKP